MKNRAKRFAKDRSNATAKEDRESKRVRRFLTIARKLVLKEERA